jgi:hypothetical protein
MEQLGKNKNGAVASAGAARGMRRGSKPRAGNPHPVLSIAGTAVRPCIAGRQLTATQIGIW